MNERVKEMWVKALRSGKYKQTRGNLHVRNGAMCCLGVLCDLAIKNGVQVTKKWCTYFGSYGYDDNAGTLPTVVYKWAGLKHDDVRFKDKALATELNDERKFTFEQIASHIEKVGIEK